MLTPVASLFLSLDSSLIVRTYKFKLIQVLEWAQMLASNFFNEVRYIILSGTVYILKREFLCKL